MHLLRIRTHVDGAWRRHSSAPVGRAQSNHASQRTFHTAKRLAHHGVDHLLVKVRI